MEPIIHKLERPIQHGTEKISELKFREPDAGDLRDFDFGSSKTGQYLDLAAKLSGEPPSVVNKLSANDTLEVVRILQGFFKSGQKTGSS